MFWGQKCFFGGFNLYIRNIQNTFCSIYFVYTEIIAYKSVLNFCKIIVSTWFLIKYLIMFTEHIALSQVNTFIHLLISSYFKRLF